MLTFQLWPMRLTTDIVCEWAFHRTIAKPDFDPHDAIDFWDLTNNRTENCPIWQASISTRGYQPGPYSNREELLMGLDRFVLERLARLDARASEVAASFACLLVVCGAAHAGRVVACGSVIDVEHGRCSRPGISIENGKIVRIGKFARAPTRSVIDWSQYTVMPGLIDLHTHLVGDIESSNVAAPLMSSAARDVMVGARNARDTLRAGFTTVRDVGVYRAFTDVALRDAIADGTVEGPRMFVAGAYVTVSQGGGEVTGLAPDVVVPAEMRRGVANSADEVRQRVREILSNGADFIKVIATGAVLANGTEPGAPEFSEAEIRAAVEEANLHGTFVAAHAHGAEGIKRAVRAGVRTIEHGSYLTMKASR